MQNLDIPTWTDLIIRWTHVFAGILWVGTTYYFTWLDGRFSELESKAANPSTKPGEQPEKNIWMVHSGGFYKVEKQRVPDVMPEKLHWFRWEAAITWLSGFLLLALVYYHQHQLVPADEWPVSHSAAVWISIGSLIVGWAVYDLLWKFLKNEIAGAVICFAVIVGATYGLFRVFSPRAACIQLGAIFGTIMVCNVWMRILPAQRRMVAAIKAGQVPNQEEAKRAKGRSKHNTFIVLPVVLLMLNQHFPVLYSHWAVVPVLVLIGWGVAKFLRRA
jgi:uncharacterized membrane protein